MADLTLMVKRVKHIAILLPVLVIGMVVWDWLCSWSQLNMPEYKRHMHKQSGTDSLSWQAKVSSSQEKSFGKDNTTVMHYELIIQAKQHYACLYI